MDTNVRNIRKLNRDDLVYPDLSYKVLGALFDVWNKVGFGYKENVYRKAVAAALRSVGLLVKEQVYTKIIYQDQVIGRCYFDFLVDGKLVLEIKARGYFSKRDIEQLYSYLKSQGLKLGLIIHFSRDGVKYKRVVNIS